MPASQQPTGAPTVRTMRPDELEAFLRIDALTFGQPTVLEPDLRAHVEAYLEQDRNIVAEGDSPADGIDGIVGIASSISFTMAVPGSAAPVAGVTWVGVVPTHRRRGVLTAMIRHQLEELHHRHGEPVAALWASEPGIYGRFGYGRASHYLSVRVPRTAALRDVPPRPAGLRLRLVDPAAALKATAAVYDAVAPLRPGMPLLSTDAHERRLFDPASRRGGYSDLRAVLAEDASGVRGYARFAVKDDWGDAGPDGKVRVRDLHALDPGTEAALWGFLLDLDLTTTVQVGLLPVDSPLLQWLPDTRRAEPRLSDALHVRLVDVDRAMAARAYAVPVDVVLELRDELCPWNAGRWRLAGDARAATFERSSAPADVSLGVRELGATYLGGTALVDLARAGLVEEHRDGAVAELSRALRHDPAPFSPFVF